MRRKGFILAAMSVAVLSSSLLIACSKKDGEEFLGTWEDKDRHSSTMTISRNGDGFLINMANKEVGANGVRNTGVVPANLKEGVLNFPNGPVTGTITYVKADNSILVSTFAGNLQFVRVK